MSLQAPNIRLLIIGDELLSGRRQDKHFSTFVEKLNQRGLKLHSAELIGDDAAQIEATLRRSFATSDIVFCCGGIGATPDDKTRQAAAAALGLPLTLHPEAEALIAQRCLENEQAGQGSADMSLPENQQRLQMGVFPEGAEIVPNSYNKIPGFFIHNHTFMPGFPVMAWPMMDWTLDTRYAQYHHLQPSVENSFLAFNLPESRIVPALEQIERDWPELSAFSLPSVGEKGGQPHIELGVKGEAQACAQAINFLRAEVQRLGGSLTANR